MKGAAIVWWRASMIAGGLAFGLIGDRRPFGESFIAHPLVVFAGGVAAALLIVRLVLGRPVPDVIPERALVIGFLLGVAGFLIGNWLSVHVIVAR
ncbi:MAG: hypothetical protein ACRECO_17770 [Xanthobacteraceae bacterium]